MTEEIQQLDNSNTSVNAPLLPPENQVMNVTKTKVENKKEKCRPMTKVVIRRLPPTMTQSQFIEQVSPLPEHDYFHFVKADMSLGQNAFSRAYINFMEQHDIFVFREKFDNYVFVDGKGTEFAAVVEFAPFQRLPKKRVGKKKDPKCGTIESDPYYINFLESLKNQDAESGTALPKTEYSYQPFDNTQKRVTTTPLLEYLKQRKAEKQRLRDEKREERRRRDIERRRTKDEPTISKHGPKVTRIHESQKSPLSQQHSPSLPIKKIVAVRVLRNPDADREVSRENKENKEEKEKPFSKESKNRKREDMKAKEKVLVPRDRDTKSTSKNYRDREDKKHDRENKHQKKHDDKKTFGKREEKESYSKGHKEDRRESKQNGNNQTRDRVTEEKRGKSYEKMRQEKKRLAEAKKQGSAVEENSENPTERTKKNQVETKNNDLDSPDDVSAIHKNKTASSEVDVKPNKGDFHSSSSNNALGSDAEVNLIDEMSRFVKESIDFTGAGDSDPIKKIKSSKIVKRRSSLESGGEGGGGDGVHLRRHKSLDGSDHDNFQKNESDDKEKDKKDPRLERRIRNKDRPAMEIYRPGMGRFSKQRLEREKSTHDERSSRSQSPTPSGKLMTTTSTTTKNHENPTATASAAELRSMTFKRSVSRDNS